MRAEYTPLWLSAWLQPIITIQNRAIRFLYKASRYTRLDYLYLNLRILKLDDLHKLEIGKFMHQFYKNTLPNAFAGYFLEVRKTHNRNTRTANTLNYVVKRYNKKAGERSVKYLGAKVWNNLPNEIQTANRIKFKTLLANYLFSKL